MPCSRDQDRPHQNSKRSSYMLTSLLLFQKSAAQEFSPTSIPPVGKENTRETTISTIQNCGSPYPDLTPRELQGICRARPLEIWLGHWGAAWSNWHRDLGNSSSYLQCPSCSLNKQLCASAEEVRMYSDQRTQWGIVLLQVRDTKVNDTKLRQLEDNAGNHRQLCRNKDTALYSSKPQPRRAVASFLYTS